MQDLIKKYFWVYGVIVMLLSTFFLAKAVNHVLAAKVLADPAKAPKLPKVAEATPTVVVAARSKDGAGLTARNMFCSECTPAAPTTVVDPSQIPTTSLPLVLIATSVSDNAAYSHATILQTNEAAKQGGFFLGDKVPGAGAIKEIRQKYIDFDNGGHLERLILLGAAPPVVAPTVAETPAPAADKSDLQVAIDNGVRKVGDNSYEIDRALVDRVLADPTQIAKGARVVPSIVDGKPKGFKLYAIKPDSVYAKLGLSNGDTLESINNFELNSLETAMQAYSKLREASAMQLNVTRRGKPVELKYAIK